MNWSSGAAATLHARERFTGPDRQFHLPPRDSAAAASMSISVQPGQEIRPASRTRWHASIWWKRPSLVRPTPIRGTKPTFTPPDVSEITIAGITGALCFNNLITEFNSKRPRYRVHRNARVQEQVLGRFEATLTGTAYSASNDLLDFIWSRR